MKARELTTRVLKAAFEIAAKPSQRGECDPESFCWPVYWHNGEWQEIDRYQTRARSKLRDHARKLAEQDPILSDLLATFAGFHDSCTPGVAGIGLADYVIWEFYAARFSKHPEIKATYAEAVKTRDPFTFDVWHREQAKKRTKRKGTKDERPEAPR